MRRYLSITVLLITLTVGLYSRTWEFEFLGFDDPELVTENAFVQQGLTWKGIKWAFFTAWRENVFYYPLSLVSHMADVTCFGLDPGGHHLTGVLLHTATVVALFTLLVRLTCAVWRPAMAAGLFAVHPLGVDSVAWVAERSNLLCAFLILVVSLAYVRYLATRKKTWYGLALGLFALALSAKPTAVMLPAGLLLIERLRPPGRPDAEDRFSRPGGQIMLELLPFVLLALVRVATVLAAGRGGSPMLGDDVITVPALAANALTAVGAYLVKFVFPFRLSVYYPFPEKVVLWPPIASAVLLLLITSAVIITGRRRPLIRLGWFWYLLFLLPSLGIVRSGPWPAMADHYVYIPLMGLLMTLVWAVPASRIASHPRKAVMTLISIGLLIYFSIFSFVHAGHYRNSIALFTRSVTLDDRNFPAYIGLGNAYRKQGQFFLAEQQFRKAIAIHPAAAGAHNNLGLVLAEKGDWTGARQHFKIALALSPGFTMARHNLNNLSRKQAGQGGRASPPGPDG